MGREGTRAVRPRRFACCAVLMPVAAIASLIPAAGAAPPGSAGAGKPLTMVLCAPGYPGSTAEAQAAMDALAGAAASAARWQAGELSAVYFETEKGCLDRLARADAAVALVPLPFWLKHRAELKLEPRLQAVQEGGEPAEEWSLVAGKGMVKNAGGLAGFEIISLAGYASRFVRGPALDGWGDVPPTATVTFSNAVLTGLRRASAGNKVALLLDREQADALPTLPFASKLEVVARSSPLPVSVLCVVAGRLPAARLKALEASLTSLGATPAGAEALAGARLARFIDADHRALAAAADAYARAHE